MICDRMCVTGWLLCLVVFSIVNAGCTDSQELRTLNDSVTKLESDLAALREEAELQKLAAEVTENSVRDISDRIPFQAVLNIASKDYSRIYSDGGTFLIGVDNVEPYANGQRLTLRIGNPQSATFRGFVMKVQWGHAMPADAVKRSAWRGTLREQEFKMANDLRGGSWNPIQITLAPATAEELGYLVVDKLSTDAVSLTAR